MLINHTNCFTHILKHVLKTRDIKTLAWWSAFCNIGRLNYDNVKDLPLILYIDAGYSWFLGIPFFVI